MKNGLAILAGNISMGGNAERTFSGALWLSFAESTDSYGRSLYFFCDTFDFFLFSFLFPLHICFLVYGKRLGWSRSQSFQYLVQSFADTPFFLISFFFPSSFWDRGLTAINADGTGLVLISYSCSTSRYLLFFSLFFSFLWGCCSAWFDV